MSDSQPDDQPAGRPYVVVGVDGSPAARAALRWALRYADTTGAAIRAVCVWTYPADFYYGMTPPSFGEVWHPDTDARQVLDDTVREVVGNSLPEGFEKVVCEGNPAKVLVDASADAAMLVVGSRGHGGFTGLLIGSVSSDCAAYARCPVLIIRGE